HVWRKRAGLEADLENGWRFDGEPLPNADVGRRAIGLAAPVPFRGDDAGRGRRRSQPEGTRFAIDILPGALAEHRGLNAAADGLDGNGDDRAAVLDER